MARIAITNHAIQRWRERVALYGDEKCDTLVSTVEYAIKLQGEPPVGISHYRLNNLLFVIKTDQFKSTVVTVVDETPKFPIQNDKQVLSKKQARISNYHSDDDEKIYQTFSKLEDKRNWLIAELKETDKNLSKKIHREFFLKKKQWIEAKLKELKPLWEEIKFKVKCEQEANRRQKEKDVEWEQWYFQQMEKQNVLS